MTKQEYEYDYVARSLSVQQWEFLADHFEGSKPVIRANPREDRTRHALVARKLIVYDNPGARPTCTMLTEKGHAVMCSALGMMADMLMRNGFDGIKRCEPKPMEKLGYGRFTLPAPRPQDGGRLALDDADRSG